MHVSYMNIFIYTCVAPLEALCVDGCLSPFEVVMFPCYRFKKELDLAISHACEF